MEIKTSDYQGECRRGNGRLTLSIRDMITLITISVTLLASGIVGWITLKGKVEANTEGIVEVKEAPLEIALIQKDIEHIKNEFSEFKIEQRDMKNTLKEILRAINGR